MRKGSLRLLSAGLLVIGTVSFAATRRSTCERLIISVTRPKKGKGMSSDLRPKVFESILLTVVPGITAEHETPILVFKFPREKVTIYSLAWNRFQQEKIPYSFGVVKTVRVNAMRENWDSYFQQIINGESIFIVESRGAQRLLIPDRPLGKIAGHLESWSADEITELALQFSLRMQEWKEDEQTQLSRYVLIRMLGGFAHNVEFRSILARLVSKELFDRFVAPARMGPIPLNLPNLPLRSQKGKGRSPARKGPR